ncbi:hypothetical protein [Paenibacillus crassostreae]|uniref:Uncharacterized protein n=1 Tax=Paenibacillus crassostreae TaxID=1763538 RepID=A0A167BTP4_9BACL|nr:hypothetical protein [Paenibacillus crassostreae]AOZ92482.1 hypothetical protein LPB68_09695 [Paenibacillus crassostreae]OAB72430.1 hypothetical protein PNBC_16140 [Paenibacillus crassostreae]
MYEGFIEMQQVVTRVQYSRDEGLNQEQYRKIEFGSERNNLHTPELTGSKHQGIFSGTPKVRRWWRN